jgi:hypothetical protein
MMLALGAAGSLIDALQSLRSSKSPSATTSTGQSQDAANPFDPGGGTQTQGMTGFSAGGTGGPSISPRTMSALITSDAASTNSSGIQTSALINLMDKIKLQPIDISQLKITALDTTNLVNTASFDIRL